MALQTNLIAFWKFDESSGNALDWVSSGTTNTLVNNNTVTYAAAKINNGASFASASSQYFSIVAGSSTGLNIAGDISISTWVKFTTITTDQTIIRRYPSIAGGYILSVSSTTITFDLADGADHIYTKAATTSTATWYHIVVVFTSSTHTVEFFVNGSSIGTTTLTGSLSAATDTLYFGSTGGSSLFVNGLVDETGIWSRVLTSLEVTRLYNAGNGISTPFELNSTLAEATGVQMTDSQVQSFNVTLPDTVSLTESATEKYGFGNQTKHNSTFTNTSKS